MDEAKLLRVLLTDNDTACPTCSYNLRDLRDNRCPECGNTFTKDELFPPLPTQPVGIFGIAIHMLNLATICFVGLSMSVCVIARFIGESWIFLPEVILLACIGAGYYEHHRVSEYLKYAPGWVLLFNPIMYIVAFFLLAAATSYLVF